MLGCPLKMTSEISFDISRPLLLEIAWEVANKGKNVRS